MSQHSGTEQMIWFNDRFLPGPAEGAASVDRSTIRPGWIDSHSHIIPTGLDLLKLNLRPCTNRQEVLDAVADWNRSNPEGWLHAVQYDQTKFEGAKHLTKHDLDKISADRPILLRHSNGHASVANSAALAAAGITKVTEDPNGGEFVRDPDGTPNGVLLERAHENVTSSAPDPTLEEMVEAVMRAGELMSEFGITCATDMMTGRWNLEQELTAYRLASEKGCKVRLRLYQQWAKVLGSRGMTSERLKEHQEAMNPDLCKISGLKIFADGAIGSATAAIHKAFKTTGGNGQLIYSEDRLKDMIKKGDEAGWSIAIHSIGDRSTDLVMDAIEATQDPTRHRIEHVMILSDAQIARLKKLGCRVSMQPEFLVRFGHAYKAQLPDDVWPHLNRARSVLDAGIPLSLSTDRPIVVGDPEIGINYAVNRPEGFDPSENITREKAEHAWTIGAADANGDAGVLGEIKPGQLADFRRGNQVWMGGKLVSGPLDPPMESSH